MTEQRKKILERGSYFPGDWVRPRFNPGTWMAMVDVQEIFAGHRSITRDGCYEMYDGPVGVRLRVEEADKSEPFIRREKEWEQEGHLGPSNFWHEDGRMHMIYKRRRKQLLRRQRRRLQLGTAGPEPEGVQRVNGEQHPRDPGARPHSRRPRSAAGRAVQVDQRRRILARPRNRRGGRRGRGGPLLARRALRGGGVQRAQGDSQRGDGGARLSGPLQLDEDRRAPRQLLGQRRPGSLLRRPQPDLLLLHPAAGLRPGRAAEPGNGACPRPRWCAAPSA